MKIVKFRDVAHLLPRKCRAVQQNHNNNGALDDDEVLHLKGDYTLRNLNLDEPLDTFRKEFKGAMATPLLLVFVEGNLEAKNIYNKEADGSTGLIVSGNVTADNMVVGGQEVFIAGNLKVNALFWGEYHHGLLNVCGNTTAQVFMTTNGYHYEYEKTRINAAHFLHDCYGFYSMEKVQTVFIKEVVYTAAPAGEICSWQHWLDRQKAFRCLAKGKALIRKKINKVTRAQLMDAALQQASKVFADAGFANEKELQQQAENFDRIVALVEDEAPEIHFHLREQDTVVTIFKKHTRHDDGKRIAEHIRIQTGNGIEIYIRKKQAALPQAPAGKSATLSICFKDGNSKGNAPQHVFDDAGLLVFTRHIWQTIIDRAEKGLYYYSQLQATVKAAHIIALLHLPVVQEKYTHHDDWAFWQGSHMYKMRSHGMNNTEGSLDIGTAYRVGDKTYFRKFCFRPDAVENPVYVTLYYCSGQPGSSTDRYGADNQPATVSPFDWQLLEEAISLYAEIVQALQKQNELYLQEREGKPATIARQKATRKAKPEPPL